jgi:hypothetical protein
MADPKKLRRGMLVYTFSKKTNWQAPGPLARQAAILIKPIKIEMVATNVDGERIIKDGWWIFSVEDGKVRRTNRFLRPIK